MFIYLKTTMLRYVTYDSRYLLDNYDYKVRTETKLMRVLPLRQQSVLVWAYPREMKLNSENFKIALVGVAMEILTFPFFYAYEISRTLQACTLILLLCLFMRSSAAFVLLRLLRSFVERFYLSKKHDCKNPECVNLSFKELV